MLIALTSCFALFPHDDNRAEFDFRSRPGDDSLDSLSVPFIKQNFINLFGIIVNENWYKIEHDRVVRALSPQAAPFKHRRRRQTMNREVLYSNSVR